MERRDLMQMFPKMSSTERLMRDALVSATRLSATEQIKRDMSLKASKVAERHLQLARSLREPISAVESAANKMMADLKALREPRNSLIDMVDRQIPRCAAIGERGGEGGSRLFHSFRSSNYDRCAESGKRHRAAAAAATGANIQFCKARRNISHACS